MGGVSAGILQAAALLLRAAVAQPDHDALQAGLHDSEQGSLGRVAVPAGLHQLPALLVEARQPLGSGTCTRGVKGWGGRKKAAGYQLGKESREQMWGLVTFSDIVPELVLAGAFLKGFWEFD